MIVLVVLLLALAAGRADAHPLAPGLLEVRADTDGTAAVLWRTPVLQPSGARLAPALPDGCEPVAPAAIEADGAAAVQRWRVRCRDGWLGATVAMRGLADSHTTAVLRIVLPDGAIHTALLTGDQPAFTVPARPARVVLVRQYAALGVHHFLTGLDHLAFVLGLVLLVPGWRTRLATITAFTLGHSVTLSLAVLGIVDFPAAWIEIAIAASIVVLAAELATARRGTPGLLSRRPWLVALTFGLLHGLGFASALAAVGLPTGEIPLALASFNVGIELGQLAFVVVVVAAGAGLRSAPWRWPAAWPLLPAYAIGSLAVYWLLERAVPLVRLGVS